MNRKQLLILLAVMPFVGIPSANALVYHYDVDFMIGSDTVTGMINTSSDSGHLPKADILSYSFFLNGGNEISGISSNITFGGTALPIVATPTTLSFAPLGSTFAEFFSSSASTGGAKLTMTRGSGNPLTYFYKGSDLATVDRAPPYQIAAISAVPLPAALPLFAGGLGVMGFLARRRKRAAAAAA